MSWSSVRGIREDVVFDLSTTGHLNSSSILCWTLRTSFTQGSPGRLGQLLPAGAGWTLQCATEPLPAVTLNQSLPWTHCPVRGLPQPVLSALRRSGLPPQLLRLPKATGTRGQVLRFLWSSLRMKRKLAKPVSQVEAAPAPVWSVVVGETLPPAEQLLASPPPATGACPVCRKTLALGARFCGSCGAHLP